MQEFHRYSYDGPVFEYERLVAEHWKAETMAPTINKARSNLIYQFKKQSNRIPSVKITLPGEIKQIN